MLTNLELDQFKKISGDKMIAILVDVTNPETINFLMNCLQIAGFDIASIGNGFVSCHLTSEKISPISESKKSTPQEFIFPSIPQLREVFEFIELNYQQRIRLKELAQAVGYSSGYLTSLVKSLTGKSVNQWIIERRLAEASTLLLETNYSVANIALKVGYQSINHFYKQFYKYYETTPRIWRESQRCKD